MSKKGWIIILVLVLVAGGGAYYYVKNQKKNRVTYEKYTVQVQSLDESIDATGEVSPMNRVDIKPPVSGRIEKLLVEEGDRVKQGQVLAWMSSSDRAAIIDAALAKGPEELKKWQDAYNPTPIVSPLSGVVILKNIVQGQTVDLSTVLYALSDRLIVLSNVDEADIGKVKIGMPVAIKLDAFPDHEIDGKVASILYEGKNVSNVITYGVKIEPKNPPPFFRSQMTANVRFELNKNEDAITVPAAAVSDTPQGEKQVLLAGPDNKPQPRAVKLGSQSGNQIQIAEGLKEGEVILVPHRRYRMQSAGPSSPLVMSGRRNQSQTQGGQGRRQQQ